MPLVVALDLTELPVRLGSRSLVEVVAEERNRAIRDLAVFDPAVYASLLEAVDAAIGSVEKGKTLEELLAYLLESIPGSTELRRNVINEFGTEEIDLIFLHQPCPDGLWFLSALILVECKNWSRPVDSGRRATSRMGSVREGATQESSSQRTTYPARRHNRRAAASSPRPTSSATASRCSS